MKNSGFENPDAHRYHLNSHVAVGEQENTIYFRAILYSHCSDVESVFLLSYSYIGVLVISGFSKPEFFMPQLLTKDIWVCIGRIQSYSLYPPWFSGFLESISQIF